MEKVKKQKSIKTQLLFSFLCVGIIPILIFSIIAGIIIKSSMYNREISSLRQISSMVTENLDKWGDDNILLVEDIATSQTVTASNIEVIQNELKNKQAQDTRIINLMYVDISGNVLADGLGSKNEVISNEDYFKELSNGYSYVSDVIIDKDNNTSFIIFSSPVKVDNEIIGYIINKIKTDAIGDNIGKITYSESGQVYTFNKEGYVTYHSDASKIMSENVMNYSNGLGEGAKEAIEGNYNSTSYSYDGEKVAAVYNYIPSLNWGTMTTISNSDIYSAFKSVFIACIPITTIITLLIVVFALYIAKSFGSFFSELAIFTQKVADGDLTINCSFDGALEIVNIGNNLNEMVSSLKGLVLSINDKSNVLKISSDELNELAGNAEHNSRDISKAMEEIAGGSVSQAEKAEEVLYQVKDLDNRMKELTDRVVQTNKVLEISDKALENGNKGTNELQIFTEEQFKLVKQAVDEVKDLGEFVRNIDTIIETISDIANQTSMLALNASIEAARAGESGRGFAVVAEEVAKLANESQKATDETTAILGNIRSKADVTNKIMNSIDDGMKRQKATVQETINIFNQIISADVEIADNIKLFSSSIEYIKQFSNELLQLIETLASSSEESAAVAQEVTASTEEQIGVVGKVNDSGDKILHIVDELKSNIDKFKTE